MSVTLLVTLLVEAVIVAGYSLASRKPLRAILFTSICGNLATQTLLWLLLNLFVSPYLLILLIAEIFIWILESLLLYALPANRLRFREAIFLSLGMNLASCGLGWFIAI